MILLLLIQLLASHRPASFELAVTFDDLPVAGSPVKKEDVLTTELVAAISRRKIPAIGFVNSSKLFVGEQLDTRQLDLLRMWVNAGLQLGNHTFSHRDLHAMSESAFEDEVIRGEAGVREVLAERSAKLEWFRHPFLHTGRSLEARNAAEKFLTSRGYRVAPVTIDSSEWIFARAYDVTVAGNDAKLCRRIRRDYIAYMRAKTSYYRAQARQLFGREISQVLLLHANQLNADSFGQLADALAADGAQFVPLERAVADAAYGSADSYFGPGGISWIHRWAITAGKTREFFAGEPVAPQYIMKLANVGRE